MNPPGLRYFLYARKSSESEDKQIASIQSQLDELKKLAQAKGLTIAAVLTEEKSAKAPGRPVFARMIQDIHSGKADGILCWKLDRLARNPVDGGTISWMLQQSLIKHIQTFQHGYFPTDNVLMMSLEFGMANQFIRDLSLNTRRGQRTKIEKGWRPGAAPIGYLCNKYNEPNTPAIYPDPKQFQIVKRLWEMILEQRWTLEALYERARAMELKRPKGTLLSRSMFYAMFRNPFYYGVFKWCGETYAGKHQPMITKEQFHMAQRILDGKRVECWTRQSFAFTGLIRCGECGASITAEKKTKRQKNGNVHHYTYYHCTKQIDPNCSQKTIRDEKLEKQITDQLDAITIPPEFHDWAMKYLKEEHSKERTDRDEMQTTYRKNLDACRKRQDTLFEMRANGELSPEEYRERKSRLVEEQRKWDELLADAGSRTATWEERAERLFTFAETARNRFQRGDMDAKREILACLGTTITLENRTLSVQTEKPLSILAQLAPEVRSLHRRLEPAKKTATQTDWAVLYGKIPKGRPLRDSNP